MAAVAVHATPIVYSGQLFDGIPILGTISQPNDSFDNPEGAVYYLFEANSGNLVEVFGDRLVGAYDMSFWIFQGTFTDTATFGGSFDNSDPGFIAFGDDEDPPNIPGPFGDPHVFFTAPSTAFYTVAVTNFASDGNPPYDFRLQANGVTPIPEPATFALLGLGLLTLGLAPHGRRG